MDVFAWSYTDIPRLSTEIVAHILPVKEGFVPVKQKSRTFKPDMSIRIKDEVKKQIMSRIVEVTS